MINNNIYDIMRKKREYFPLNRVIKRTTLKFTAICGIIVLTALSFTCFNRSVFAEQRAIPESRQVILHASRIVWKYKVENGALWKRKYNLDTEKWIGDWIRA